MNPTGKNLQVVYGAYVDSVKMDLRLDLDDLLVLNAMRFRRDLLPTSDKIIAHGFDYMNGFPRIEPVAGYYKEHRRAQIP